MRPLATVVLIGTIAGIASDRARKADPTERKIRGEEGAINDGKEIGTLPGGCLPNAWKIVHNRRIKIVTHIVAGGRSDPIDSTLHRDEVATSP
jgi:hypothetical protein